MATKFKEKEKQEALLYVLVFAVVFILLVNVRGMSFDFSPSLIVLEEKHNFSEIINVVEGLEEKHQLSSFKEFQFIESLDESYIGRRDIFNIGDMVLPEEVSENEITQEVSESEDSIN